MSFFGLEVHAQGEYKQVIPQFECLRITQAAISRTKAVEAGITTLFVGEETKYPICHLSEKNDHVSLDYLFQPGEELTFSVQGPNSICVSGFREKLGEDLEEDEDDSYLDEDEELGEEEEDEAEMGPEMAEGEEEEMPEPEEEAAPSPAPAPAPKPTKAAKKAAKKAAEQPKPEEPKPEAPKKEEKPKKAEKGKKAPKEEQPKEEQPKEGKKQQPKKKGILCGQCGAAFGSQQGLQQHQSSTHHQGEGEAAAAPVKVVGKKHPAAEPVEGKAKKEKKEPQPQQAKKGKKPAAPTVEETPATPVKPQTPKQGKKEKKSPAKQQGKPKKQ